MASNATATTMTTAQQKETTTYGDMVKKQTLAPMLGLQPDDPFDIVSENENLTMVHYRPDADLEIFGNLRGIILDTKVGNVVSYSYPHAPTIIASQIVSEDGFVKVGNQVLDESKIRIKIGFEGTMIHVFKHAGKVYRSTRKRLDPSKSKWGNSKTFGEMYWDLSGPSDEALFDVEKDYSPYVHSFILAHPDVQVCSKDDVGNGCLIYLGPKTMYSTEPEECPYPIESVDCLLRVPETTSVKTQGTIYSPEKLTLEDANKHLLFGFYEKVEGYEYLDPRLLPGEFVILENSETGKMFRIESHSYNWRASIRNNNPNLLHRFFELLDYSYFRGNDDFHYSQMFPVLTFYDYESLSKNIKENPIIIWPQKTEIEHSVPTNKDSKLYNIWQAFLICVPLAQQKEVVEFLNILVARRSELINWLIETSEKKGPITDYSRRAQDILVKTRTFAENRVKDSRYRDGKSVDELTRDNIRNFISKEKGNSLYKLIREMDRIKNPRVVE